MKDKTAKILEYLFGILLICQVGFIIFFNLSDIRCSLDHDAANTIYYFTEIIKNKTLNLPDWYHTTSLEVDNCFVFALPIYWIVRDIFLSIGLANIVMAGLYIFVASRILTHANVKKIYILFTLCLVITPYSFGMLEYFNMLFFGCAYYSVKTIVPLLFLLLIQLFDRKGFDTKAQKAEFWTVLIIYTVLLFLTAFSTGFYAVLCGIFPSIACMILDIWIDGKKPQKYNKGHLGLIVGSFIIFVLGYLIHKNLYPESMSRTDMKLTIVENYAINFRACVSGIFQVFGALVSEEIPAMSPWGIIYCLKMGLVVLFLIAFIFNVKALFDKTHKLDIKKYLTVLFLFNFLLLLVADSRYPGNMHTEYRYFLIGAVPLVLLFGIQLSEWGKKWNFFQQISLNICVFFALLLVMAGNNKGIVDAWDRTTYAVEVCDYFNTLDIESAFFVNDPDTAKICKGIDQNHKYGAYMSDSQTLDLSICSYKQSTSGAFYGSKNVLAVINWYQLEEVIPEDIAVHYEKIGTVRWYDIYYSDEVYFP